MPRSGKNLEEWLRRIKKAIELYPEVERDREIAGSGAPAGVLAIEPETGEGSKGHQDTGKDLDLMLRGRKGVMRS